MKSHSQDYKRKIITIPNLLSILRLCLIPLIIWLYRVKENSLLTTAVLLLSGLTDMVDGYIARRFNMISDVGKVLDPIADKATQIVMLLCLLSRFQYMMIPLLLLVVKEIFSAVTGLITIYKTKKVYGAYWHGKANTVLLYAMMLVHLVWVHIPVVVSNILIGLCTIMMCISFLLYGILNFKIILGHQGEKICSEDNEYDN